MLVPLSPPPPPSSVFLYLPFPPQLIRHTRISFSPLSDVLSPVCVSVFFLPSWVFSARLERGLFVQVRVLFFHALYH